MSLATFAIDYARRPVTAGPKWRPPAESLFVCTQVCYEIERFVTHDLGNIEISKFWGAKTNARLLLSEI